MSGLQWQGQWDPFREFRREVGRLLGNFESMGVRVARPFPALNLYDDGDRYYLTAELPGVDPKEIDLSIAGATVTIRGEKHSVPLAIQRSLAHCGYHVGQVVLIARILAGDRWETITIPRGGSAGYNQRVWGEGHYQSPAPGGQ